MTEHSDLTPERWARFSRCEQVLQIGAEMQRGLKWLRPDRSVQLRACYERAMQLVALTIKVQENNNLRRELTLFQSLLVDLSQRDEPDPKTHRDALKALLYLDPEASLQVSILGL